MQKDFLSERNIESLYFGGGTPSLLDAGELITIIDKIRSYFNILNNAEITLEANPDDLTFSYLKNIESAGINRLSIGIQSFFEDDLKWMNRRHNRDQAIRCIENSLKAGFKNINIDLLYGYPNLNKNKWIENLNIAFANKIHHLSAYNLTLEPKTVYFNKVKKGLMEKPDEEAGIRHFEILLEKASNEGFIHYEISNFCLPGYFSKHNTSYWIKKPYLGIGPSANSYNGRSRFWNARNNSLYINKINEGIIPASFENLGIREMYNEYILTSLRTMWGIDLKLIEKEYGNEFYNLAVKESAELIRVGKIEKKGSNIYLTKYGKLFADAVISRLFMI